MWGLLRRSGVLRAILLLGLAGCLIYLDLRNVAWSLPRDRALKDFGSFVASGRLAADGLNPYGSHPLVFHSFGRDAPNLNPPISVLVFHLLGPVDPSAAFRAWYFISLGLYLLLVVVLCRAYPQQATPLRVAWALSLAGLWHVLELGQIYMPLWLAVTGAWLCLRRRRALAAGILIGLLVAVKPNFFVWPALLVLAGYWAVAASAYATAGAVSLVPLAVYGPEVYRHWFQSIPTEANELASNASLAAVTARMGVPWLGVLASVVLLSALAVWAWRCRPPVLRLSGLALLGALLASPVTWVGYTLVLLPVLFGCTWTRLARAGAILLVFPIWLVFAVAYTSPLSFVVVGSVYGWGLLLIFAALIRQAVTPPSVRTNSGIHDRCRADCGR